MGTSFNLEKSIRKMVVSIVGWVELGDTHQQPVRFIMRP